MKQKIISKKDRALLGILFSIVIGIATSFTITFIFDIQLNEQAKLAVAVVPPIVAAVWTAKVKRKRSAKLRSKRLWAAISHGITFGILNFLVDKTFFDGLRALTT